MGSAASSSRPRGLDPRYFVWPSLRGQLEEMEKHRGLRAIQPGTHQTLSQ